jgi:dihydroflavonol-4-reductase
MPFAIGRLADGGALMAAATPPARSPALPPATPIARAFVTGSTGLLGNNLVRLLASRGISVRALARSREKADRQFADVARGTGPGEVEIVEGDLGDIDGFTPSLAGSDVLFHTAAYFRESYRGGDHRTALHDVNVTGTRRLLLASYLAGIRRFVHTSSVAVLDGEREKLIDETMLRSESTGDPYYRSKILSDREVLDFLERHPDTHATLVLPGWMFGPGDVGPTTSGQAVLEFSRGRVPAILPGTFSVVDARDVAIAMHAAAERGRRGERYLAAGRHTSLADLYPVLERVTGVAGPRFRLPIFALFVAGLGYELIARVTRRPVLISLATARLIAREAERTHFDHAKSERELGVGFRPLEETVSDTVAWYRQNAWLPPARGSD